MRLQFATLPRLRYQPLSAFPDKVMLRLRRSLEQQQVLISNASGKWCASWFATSIVSSTGTVTLLKRLIVQTCATDLLGLAFKALQMLFCGLGCPTTVLVRGN
mmetsp:Transcript_135249/g.337422  ORF Transcript_135249/g.337422 Transcript_135249/m.337422 type:complete len:103 (-) Transcript_135249:1122-1430(-)